MRPGYVLVLYTDGLLGRGEGRSGLAELRAELPSAASGSAVQIVKLIEAHVSSMASEAAADDVAVLVLKIPRWP